MVMMQSPNSDTPQSASPLNSTPCSPNGNQQPQQQQTKTTASNAHDTPLLKFEPIILERPQPTKFDGAHLLANFHDKDDIDIKNRPITYPKDIADIDANTKFSLERLKQLSNRTLYNRQSPSDDSNQSPKYTNGTKFNSDLSTTPPKKCVDTDTNQSSLLLNPYQKTTVVGCHQFYANHPTDMDLERLKLARSMTNGKDFSDFGFRIHLGDLHSDYAHSDTSEELIVDEKNDLPSRDTSTVCLIMDFPIIIIILNEILFLTIRLIFFSRM